MAQHSALTVANLNDDKPRPTLMGLPWVLRRDILRYLLDVPTNYETVEFRSFEEDKRQSYIPELEERGFMDGDPRPRSDICKLHVQVLRVCKQLHAEGLQILLKENHFTALVGQQSDLILLPWIHAHLVEWGYAFWEVNWRWDSTTAQFDSPAGLFRPRLTISPCDQGLSSTAAVLVSAADTEGLVIGLHDYARYEGSLSPYTSYPLGIPTLRLKFSFSQMSSKPKLSRATYDDVQTFMFQRVFPWIGESISKIEVGNPSSEEQGTWARSYEKEDIWSTTLQRWRQVETQDRLAKLRQYVFSDVHEISTAMSNGNLANAVEMLSALRPKVQCSLFLYTPSHSWTEGAYYLGCVAIAMQDRWQGKFRCQEDFWRWASVRLAQSFGQVIWPVQWIARILVRIIEMQLRLSVPAAIITKSMTILDELMIAMKDLETATNFFSIAPNDWSPRLGGRRVPSVMPGNDSPESVSDEERSELSRVLDKHRAEVHFRWGTEYDLTYEAMQELIKKQG